MKEEEQKEVLHKRTFASTLESDSDDSKDSNEEAKENTN